MQLQDIGLILAFFVLVLAPAPFLGRFYYRVMEGQRTFLTPMFAPVERFCYRIAGVDAEREQDWKTYCAALLAFNLAGLVLLFAILMLQGVLPLNPQKLPGLEWSLAFNTAVSFVTNTNWQAYSGEATLGRHPDAGSYRRQAAARGARAGQRRRPAAAPQPAGLRPGWPGRALCRHQGDRRPAQRSRPGVNAPGRGHDLSPRT
ncbi:Potassium-transporting ATPase A chain [compost metagenome]